MGLKLEAGKRYVTRSGWITPPIEEDVEADADSSMRFYAGDESWSAEGGVFVKGMHIGDLVAEFDQALLPCDASFKTFSDVLLTVVTWEFLSSIGFSVEPCNTLFHWPSAPDVKIEIVGKEAEQRVVCLIGRKTRLYLKTREDVMALVRLLQKEVADA